MPAPNQMCIVCSSEFYTSLGDCLCESCRDVYFICDSCDEVYRLDYYATEGLCNDCWDEVRGCSVAIHDYHEGCPNGTIFYPDDSQSLYFGIELETDEYGNYQSAAEDVLELSDDERLFWLEEDCSLTEGFELITQPCTLQYHKEHFPWAKICEVLKRHGGHAEDSDKAALHVHLSKRFFPPTKRRMSALRMIYIFEKYRDEMLRTGNTSEYLAGRSARKHIPDYENIEQYLDTLTVGARYDRFSSDRYTSVNVDGGHGTIEVRIFRSTLDPTRIIGSIELVDHVAQIVRNFTVSQLRRLSWKRIVDLARGNGYAQLGDIICPRKIVKPRPRRATDIFGQHTTSRSNPVILTMDDIRLARTEHTDQQPNYLWYQSSYQPRTIYGHAPQGYRDRPDLEIVEGLRVRICIPEDQQTSHGRAGVTNDVVGTVASAIFGDIYVLWDSMFQGRWCGTNVELVVVEEVHDEPEQAEPSGDNGQRDWRIEVDWGYSTVSPE